MISWKKWSESESTLWWGYGLIGTNILPRVLSSQEHKRTINAVQKIQKHKGVNVELY